MATNKNERARRKPRRKKTARKPQLLARNANDDFTIGEWCRKRRVSRGTFYKMLKKGTAPNTLKIKKRRTITFEADADWQAKREAATAVELAT